LREEEQMSLTTILPGESIIPPTASHGSPPAGVVSLLPLAAMQDLVQLFKLLADESRLKILNCLMQSEELNVRTLCGLLQQSQPAVSHHLALLKEAGLIECRREGKHNFYRLVTRRCRAYLDSILGTGDGQVRRVNVENAVLTYGPNGAA
jgi:ArsR family transcriptional regulator, arsenate/arsenite/antimonite-responsive transcriptional repressor